MRPEEYLIAIRAIHIELERLHERLMELAKFRCADPSNQVFLNIMGRQAELFDELNNLHDQAVSDFRNSSRSTLA